MNQVVCPHCKKTFEITEAITHEIEEKIVSQQLKQAKENALEKEERIKSLINQVTEITIELRASKRKQEESKIEMQKKLLEEEEKIRTDAQKKAEEMQRLKLLEKDKQLSDAIKEVEEMKRKLSQGSQQTQGEVFEQEFQQTLKNEFPNDTIKEVAKGVRGGDIIQEVWDRNGNLCGTLLWELKNTKTWSEQWIAKLKADQLAAKADYAVIISQTTPSNVDTARYYKNVWVTKQSFVIGLACALRINLIQIAMAKRASEGNKEKKDILYSYVSSTEFKLRLQAIVEAFSNMQMEIEKEKRYFANKWARDEKNIRQVIDNTYGIHGDLKGIIGNTLPQIKGIDFETPEITDGVNS